MKNDWDGRPAYKEAHKVRCVRRFRQQVWSPRHPERRIHRVYTCANAKRCKARDVQTEAHHLDYREPYVVVYVCLSCHRRIETGDLKVRKRWVHDYTSLVFQNRGGHRTDETVARKPREETPF